MSILEKFPNISSSELRTLVNVTARVMMDSDEAQAKLPSDFLDISTASASHELVSLLGDLQPDQSRFVQNLLEDEDLSEEISIAILEEVRKYPELARRVEESYEDRIQKLTGVETLLLAAAVVILAIKIKEFRWSRDGVVVNFFESQEVVKSFITGLLKKLPGVLSHG